ncbi:unnamed protein product [Urochloa humidicola]
MMKEVEDEDQHPSDEEEEEQKSVMMRGVRSKAEKRDSEDWLFDEEDYMLLQGNNITGISLSKPRNKFKRLKKAGKESEMDEHGLSGSASATS